MPGVTKYAYGKDTALNKVILPSKAEIKYEYSKSSPISPVKRFRRGELTTEYVWLDPVRLSACLDHDHQLEYTFLYDESGILDRVRIVPVSPTEAGKIGTDTSTGSDWLSGMVMQNKRERLHSIFGKSGKPLDLYCSTDQVGTLKILADASGKLVKEIQRDSFGAPLFDSFPDLFMPIGFAGGLVDPDTGLVRFGHRDYDPTVGRFTTLDPLGDTGGDHDLYDYCVDDPVTLNDPTGLYAFPLAKYIGGKLLAAGIAAAGTAAAATAADKLADKDDDEESHVARDGVTRVAPYALDVIIDAASMGRSPAKLWKTYKLVKEKQKEGKKE